MKEKTNKIFSIINKIFLILIVFIGMYAAFESRNIYFIKLMNCYGTFIIVSIIRILIINIKPKKDE